MYDKLPRSLPPGIEPISGAEARQLIDHADGVSLEALLDRAEAVRRAVHGDEVALCAITNAKSGNCVEDCAFCAQSARFERADAPVYSLITPEEMAVQARRAEQAGAREFSIVASGTRLYREHELERVENGLRRIRAETAVEPCASLGLMRGTRPADHVAPRFTPPG